MVFSYSNPSRLRQSHWEEELKQQLFPMHSLKIKMKLTRREKTFYQAPPIGNMESKKEQSPDPKRTQSSGRDN